MKNEELKQIFVDNSDCYTEVFYYGIGYHEEPAMSEDKFIEVVNNILIDKQKQSTTKSKK